MRALRGEKKKSPVRVYTTLERIFPTGDIVDTLRESASQRRGRKRGKVPAWPSPGPIRISLFFFRQRGPKTLARRRISLPPPSSHLVPAECSCHRARHAPCTGRGQAQGMIKGSSSEAVARQIQQASWEEREGGGEGVGKRKGERAAPLFFLG